MAEKEKFFMVLRDGSTHTTFRHISQDDAEAEARRIARLKPGSAVFVLELISAFEVEEPPITEHRLVYGIPF